MPGNSDTGDRLAAKEKGRIVGILHNDFPLDDSIKAVLRQYYDNGIRLWQVCPHPILAIGRIVGWEFTFSDSIPSALKNNFCIFRSARAGVVLSLNSAREFVFQREQLQVAKFSPAPRPGCDDACEAQAAGETRASALPPPNKGLDDAADGAQEAKGKAPMYAESGLATSRWAPKTPSLAARHHRMMVNIIRADPGTSGALARIDSNAGISHPVRIQGP